MCKVLKSQIRDTIDDHMKINKLYTECQHGFRKHQSCITQLLEVMEDFTLMLDSRETIDVVYLEGLLMKLGAIWSYWKYFKMDQIIPGKQITESQSWKINIRSYSSFKLYRRKAF